MPFRIALHDRRLRQPGRALLTILCLSSSLIAASSFAEPALGVGVAFVPGTGWAVGIKAISDNEERSRYVSLGMDYIIAGPDQAHWRPSLGVGYQSTSIFDEINVGYTAGEFDWGLAAGFADNSRPEEPEGVGCPPDCGVTGD